MNETGANATWDVLKQFGFTPDLAVMSDVMPGLSFDLGNFKLSASAVMGKTFKPAVLFTGWITTPRKLAEVNFEIPRNGMSCELVAAIIVWNLDRPSPDKRFTPVREVPWLELGRQNQRLLPWEVARAKLRQLEVDRAARPHCTVGRSLLAMALKSLAVIFENERSGNKVVVAFDGHLLSFDCNGLKTDVVATGTAWPARYKLEMAAIADVLPIRLRNPEPEVGIWKSMLEIDRVLCLGVKEVK